MSDPKFVDPHDMEGAIERERAILGDKEQPGYDGCYVRLAHAVLFETQRWMVSEINRESKPVDVRRAIATLCANIMLTFARTAAGGNDDVRDDHMMQMYDEMLFAIAQKLNAPRKNRVTVPIVRGGRA